MANTKNEDKIPIVDVQNLYKISINDVGDEEPGETKKLQEIAKNFRHALNQYGFAYLVNHGIPQDLINRGFEKSLKYFELPPTHKEKYVKVDAAKNYHGYARPGMEFLNSESTIELRETWDLAGTDRYYPTEVPNFAENLESLESACRAFMWRLLKVLGMALKLKDPNFFCRACTNLVDPKKGNVTNLRTLYYPPIAENVQISPGTVRCATHTDWGILTMLFQDENGGLDVKGTNGWISADPVPGTILVNTGDLLEAYTSKYFSATAHRVLVPEAEIKKRTTRQSMAYFQTADDDVLVFPLESPLWSKNEMIPFEPLSASKYFLDKAAQAYGQK